MEFNHPILTGISGVFAKNPIFYICILIIILIILSTIFYVNSKINLNSTNCSNLSQIYTSIPPLNSVSKDDSINTHALRDFYVKSAYNACSPGNFKNDFVNLCALTTCLSQGVRFLDFEIYSINDQPVVATSSVLDYTVKETYNYIPISEVFSLIVEKAFSSGFAPNFEDPIILHFRIMSNNCKMYNNLAKAIYDNSEFNSYTLGKKYSYEYNEEGVGTLNLGAVPIKELSSKIIISVDGNNKLYQHTKLDEYINITSSSPFLKLLRFNQVEFTQDMDFEVFNKKYMSIVLPNISANDSNPNFNLAREYGCQFIAMSFQNYDVNLEHYNEFFDANKAAFVLKPNRLRYVPITIKKPPLQNPKYSYATRKIKSDFYDYNI